MTQPDDDSTTTTTERTFTRSEVRKMIAAEVGKVRDQFADYDELKKAAAEADKSKSDIEKLTASVQALTDRATKAEETNMRREIADEFGLTPREARRLTGRTAEELRADAEEFVEDMGIDVTARKAGKSKTETRTATQGEGTEGEKDAGETSTAAESDASRDRRTTRARPREDLASGAARTETKPEETNPLKLVENIPRR